MVSGPVSSRTIFAASEAKLMWNATGSALLIFAHADTDATSYYGATGLFLMQAIGGGGGGGGELLAIKVEQTKEGPVHDVAWQPTEGRTFVVAAGTMPCQCTLHDGATGDPVYQYGMAHRNTICWSPHGRFLCIAGFGNLAGEMDFYDVLRSKKLGSNSSHCATYHAWSPDSRYFLTASLAPRMNVDNNLKVFKYNSVGPVVQVPFDRAYNVGWQPAAASVYPNRGPSPKRPGAAAAVIAGIGKPTATTTAATAKPAAYQPYRPPGSTGAVSMMMAGGGGRGATATAAVGKVPKASASASANKFTPSVQKQRLIPGMAPAAASKKTATAAAAATTAGGGAGSKKKSSAAGGGGQAGGSSSGGGNKPPQPPQPQKKSDAVPNPTSSNSTAAPPPAAGPLSAEEKEKKAKGINKKLKAIQEIKTKQASGQKLEPEQLKKLETESELVEELRKLTV